ncbi:MAG: nucleotidyltransferase domain-containing protein [Betaproteobacteria bacterium]|nr:nucleotidyltransferase domain-containing protein [Betaproteobacteria bacterium]
MRPRDWYLSIDVQTKRYVIVLPINGLLDIDGRDPRKALKLPGKLNPSAADS